MEDQRHPAGQKKHHDQHGETEELRAFEQLLFHLVQGDIEVQDPEHPSTLAMAWRTALFGVDRFDDTHEFTTGRAAKDIMPLPLQESAQAVRVHAPANFIGLRRFENPAVGMENSHTVEPRVAADHFQDRLNITRVASTHRTADGPLDDRHHQVRSVQAGFGDVIMFTADMEQGHTADRKKEEQE